MCYLLIKREDAPHLADVARENPDMLQRCFMRGDCISRREDDGVLFDNQDTWDKNYLVHLPGVPASRMAYLMEEEWTDTSGVVKERIVNGKRYTYTEKPVMVRRRKVQFDISGLKDRLSRELKTRIENADNDPTPITEGDLAADGVTRDRLRVVV